MLSQLVTHICRPVVLVPDCDLVRPKRIAMKLFALVKSTLAGADIAKSMENSTWPVK
jgi:hypothetical protein